MRRVISLWLPRFATERRSHNRRERRAWRDRPLALVARDRGRLLLAAVNGPAAGEGLTPGLALADARALLPALATAPHDPLGDGAALARLADWCGRYTPWSAPCSTSEGSGFGPGGAGGLLLDITGCAHLFARSGQARSEEVDGETALLKDLVGRLGRLGFTARAGLADTPGAAWALARFAAGPTSPCPASPWSVARPGETSAALDPLPPAALRLPDAAVELMARFGLRRVSALRALPSATLTSRFGPQVARRLAQALGERAEPISPRRPAPAYLARRVFAEAIIEAEAIVQALETLVAGLCRELEAASAGARRIELTCYRVDGSLERLQLGTSRPSRDDQHLRRLFAGHLAKIDPGFGIEVMTLAAPVSERLSALQLALGGHCGTGQAGGRHGAATGGTGAAGGAVPALVDRLGARLGRDRIRRPLPRESHIPERAVVHGTPLAAAAAGFSGARPAAPRPLRLLPRPEPIEAVALLPDHPPARFRWRRLLHHVVRAEGPERLAPEWWLADPARAEEAPRDYFRVEDRDGHRYWLYRADNRWFLQGLFA
jgi:protein ImuB